MLVNPQTQQWSQASGQFRFTPVSSNVSGLGTTVTYSLNPNVGINAYNANAIQSGVFFNANALQAGYFANPQYNIAGAAAIYPTTNAAQFGQLTSGAYIGAFTRGMVQPSIDISETSSDVIITAYVGNANVNDLRLNVTEDSCTISASAWTGAENLVMSRTVCLPTVIRAEACDASLQSGVLEIRCPKADKNLRARTTITPDAIKAQ